MSILEQGRTNKKTPALKTRTSTYRKKKARFQKKKQAFSQWFVPRKCVGTKLIYLAAKAVQI